MIIWLKEEKISQYVNVFDVHHRGSGKLFSSVVLPQFPVNVVSNELNNERVRCRKKEIIGKSETKLFRFGWTPFDFEN